MIMDLGKESKPNNRQLVKNDYDQIGLLSAAYARKKKAVLIFCPSKMGCEE